jgi:hypothetical protein
MKAPILLLLLFAEIAASQNRQTGMYARSATPIWDLLWSDSGTARPVLIPSPSRSARLIARWIEGGRDLGVQLTLEEHGTTLWSRKVTPGVGIEAAWAPDSKAFFVTNSGGGRNGFYGLTVYFLNGDAVSEVELTPAIETAFGHPVKCQSEEPPNVAGVKWAANSKGLIAAAEIVGHGNCDSDSTFRAYQVSLPEGRIIRSYDQTEAKRLFGGDLGWEIKNAPDRCIRRPTSCWQYFNHDSIK